MSVEIELTDFLNRTVKELDNKSRDIALVEYYYGLGEDAWPTYETIGERYGLTSRERPRQIIDSKFRKKQSNRRISLPLSAPRR